MRHQCVEGVHGFAYQKKRGVLVSLEAGRYSSLMKLCFFASVLLSIALASSTPAPTMPPSAAGNTDSGQQTRANSATYEDTLKMLKDLNDSRNNVALARLFEMDDSKISDLQTACQSSDYDISSAAFLVLQLLGKRQALDCHATLRKREEFAFLWEPNLADRNFKLIEKSLDEKRIPKGYKCGDDSERIDNSLVYALVLNGSPRARSLLHRLLAFAEACVGGYIMEDLKHAPSLIRDAEKIGRNLSFEADNMESVVRTSAFYLPAEYRKDSRLRVIAYNKAGDRLLLEMSYTCGLLCGRGYHVVLRKQGPAWQYAIITMTWIS